MEPYTQENRQISITTPLGTDVLLLTSIEGAEHISQLFCYQANMLSDNAELDPKKIVGHSVTATMHDSDNEPKYINGVVRKFSNKGRGDRGSVYTAEIVPWMWLLSRNSDCRIFQDMTVPQIIEAVFQSHQLNDFKMSDLQEKYNSVEYCVQYQETDFQFVSRLMEQEGIHYYFIHEKDKHVLQIGDDASSYKDCKDNEVRFSGSLGMENLNNQIVSWEHFYEYRSGRVASKDFNFKSPTQPMLAKDNTNEKFVRLDGNTNYELYHYPGGFDCHSPAKKKEDDNKYRFSVDGEKRVRLLMQQEEVAHNVVKGESKCRSFSPGHKFTVTEHNNPQEEGKTFVVTAVQHKANSGSYVTGGKEPEGYQNKFECIPDKVVFRPSHTIEKPRIRGPQTAMVVGPEGEEIYTDEHGRVKVQFHWDRYGQYDDKSSCWVRVSHNLAGKKWGAINIPRIGHEVIVEFMEGDPDRPIITGRVYNGEATPPYELPKHKTMSTFKSNSSKGGQGFNEIRMEDKKDQEQLFIHAQRDMDIRVLNDRFETILNNRHCQVKVDKFEHVENNRNEKVDADHMEEIGKDRHLAVKGKQAVSVDGSHSLVVTDDVIEQFKANHSHQVTGDYYVKASNIVIEGTSNVTIKVGGSYIAIEAGGIKIGTTGEIALESTGPLSAKGTAGVTVESPAQTQVKGTQTTVEGSAMTTIKGGMVKIN